MKIKFVIPLLIVVMFPSCYTTKITPDFLQPKTNNSDLLSSLNYRFDDDSFNLVFTPTRKIIDESYSEGETESQHEIIVVRENQNLHDVKSLIKKYANVPVQEPGLKKGDLVFDVTFYDSKSTHFFRALSVISFGILNLVGMPSNRYLHTIEIEASIFNNNGDLINTYRGFGRDHFLTGIYYYSSNQKRASFLKAAKSALAEIDRQMVIDKEDIFKKLMIKP